MLVTLTSNSTNDLHPLTLSPILLSLLGQVRVIFDGLLDSKLKISSSQNIFKKFAELIDSA